MDVIQTGSTFKEIGKLLMNLLKVKYQDGSVLGS